MSMKPATPSSSSLLFDDDDDGFSSPPSLSNGDNELIGHHHHHHDDGDNHSHSHAPPSSISSSFYSPPSSHHSDGDHSHSHHHQDSTAHNKHTHDDSHSHSHHNDEDHSHSHSHHHNDDNHTHSHESHHSSMETTTPSHPQLVQRATTSTSNNYFVPQQPQQPVFSSPSYPMPPSASSPYRRGGLESVNHNWGVQEEKPEEKLHMSPIHYIRLLLSEKESKNMTIFLVIYLIFALLEILYGTHTNSLGLISEAFHSLFDCLGMMVSLLAMISSKYAPTRKYSYGYDRLEVLAGFANGAFLLFVSFFLFVEAIERVLEPPLLHSHGKVISVAICSLLMTGTGFFFFSQHRSSEGKVSKARKENMASVRSHLFVDLCSSFGVIISAILDTFLGWHYADTVVSVAIAVLIVLSALPICQRTAKILLQATPEELYTKLIACLREAGTLEGVLEYVDEHFWTIAPGIHVGSLCVKVHRDANEDHVRLQVTRLFAPHLSHFTVQVEKENWSIPSSSPSSSSSHHHH
eukprot:TRINITY_DN6566_c2_g1_i1.p1 TRINITY_DN6566_c2_g1~~TRINITY_DN6566_c2_g1_i1.p1  ORF type:complete len:520 (-),score=143.37 TRINITY_DN6566_c2_g1_i1:90-1649(-)